MDTPDDLPIASTFSASRVELQNDYQKRHKHKQAKGHGNKHHDTHITSTLDDCWMY